VQQAMLNGKSKMVTTPTTRGGWEASSVEDRGVKQLAERNQTSGGAVAHTVRWTGRMYERLNQTERKREVARLAAIRVPQDV
jgi:hypothetical protein